MDEKEKLTEFIKEMLIAYENQSAVFNVVTKDFKSLEDFLGDSKMIETSEGNPFKYDGKYLYQFFDDGKIVQTEFENEKIKNVQYLVDKPNSQLNKLKDISNALDKLIDLESSDTDADKKI
ncbi:hypothetical protein CIRMBP1205_00909 [Enterococcus cecorum]|nr:hypothetical protein CIRMBP1205_00909 [Enterococcus cecorum]